MKLILKKRNFGILIFLIILFVLAIFFLKPRYASVHGIFKYEDPNEAHSLSFPSDGSCDHDYWLETEIGNLPLIGKSLSEIIPDSLIEIKGFKIPNEVNCKKPNFLINVFSYKVISELSYPTFFRDAADEEVKKNYPCMVFELGSQYIGKGWGLKADKIDITWSYIKGHYNVDVKILPLNSNSSLKYIFDGITGNLIQHYAEPANYNPC